MRMRQSAGLIVVALLAIGCGSRGPAMAPTSGKVTFNDQPLANANVVFVPEAGGPTSIGLTGSDGEFKLSSNGKPGAMVGKHQVSVQATERYRRDGKSDPVPLNEIEAEGATKSPYATRSIIPQTYGVPESSGLTAEVTKGGKNEFTFELSGPPPKK